MSVVLAPFPFAADGFTIEHLAPGDEREFGVLTGGLVKAGLVSDGAPKMPPKAAPADENPDSDPVPDAKTAQKRK